MLSSWISRSTTRRSLRSMPRSVRARRYSYKEIAAMTDTRQGTVSSRLNRGRKQLRDLLFEHLEFCAGVGAMAVLGIMELPVVAALVGHTLGNARLDKVFQSLGEASKWPSCNRLRAGAVLWPLVADLAS